MLSVQLLKSEPLRILLDLVVLDSLLACLSQKRIVSDTANIIKNAREVLFFCSIVEEDQKQQQH